MENITKGLCEKCSLLLAGQFLKHNKLVIFDKFEGW